jgi:phosphomannomutase/phosphoglucomutase
MIFRTYDIRGVVGDTLTDEISQKIGRAFGSEMSARNQTQVIVGRDNRPSSKGFSDAFMQGVREAGLNTVDIGEVATPVVYFASVKADNAPAVMITGSHLPPSRNGFKMTQGTIPFYGDDIQGLKERIENDDYTSGSGKHTHDPQASASYVADLGRRFPRSDNALKIVVDAGNGMAGWFAPILLRYMGHTLYGLYTDPDGSYPNHPADPFEEKNLDDAKQEIKKRSADLALAFDGDADRIGFLDNRARFHSTDRVMIPVMREVLKKHPGANIVTDALVSQILISEIRKAGGNPVMWKSGHSNIKNKMKEVKAPLAIETSGHVFIADDYYGYDDGIYTGMRMVHLLGQQGASSLAKLMDELPTLATSPQFRPPCPEEKKQTIINAVGKAFEKYDISTIDGVRVNLDRGWFIVRASNTEPKLSIRFEAQDNDYLQKMQDSVEKVLNHFEVNLYESGGH